MSGAALTPAKRPPEGQVSNFVKPTTRSTRYITVNCVFLPIGFVAAAIRVWTRLFITREFRLRRDDGKYFFPTGRAGQHIQLQSNRQTWDVQITHGTCIDRPVFYFVNACLGILTEFATVLIPTMDTAVADAAATESCSGRDSSHGVLCGQLYPPLQSVIDSRTTLAAEEGTSKPVLDYALEENISNRAAFPQDKLKRVIIDNMRSFVFAGHDTTASTISFIYLMLERYPAVLVKVQQEHDQVFSTDLSQTAQKVKDSPALLNQLPYTLAVIKEVLRLYPIGHPAKHRLVNMSATHNSGRQAGLGKSSIGIIKPQGLPILSYIVSAKVFYCRYDIVKIIVDDILII
ncbi:cytochrome P450 [Aspergillus spectabilis]